MANLPDPQQLGVHKYEIISVPEGISLIYYVDFDKYPPRVWQEGLNGNLRPCGGDCCSIVYKGTELIGDTMPRMPDDIVTGPAENANPGKTKIGK